MEELVKLELPMYAVRYLIEMCKRDREYINCIVEGRMGLSSIGTEASYDSLNCIESVLPCE